MGLKSRTGLAAVLAASLILGSLGTAGAQQAKDYEGRWTQKTIESWLSSGSLKGFADGSVKPNQPAAAPAIGGGGGSADSGGGGNIPAPAPSAPAQPALPLLNVKLATLDLTTAFNTIYLQIDFSAAKKNGNGFSYVSVYITTEPVTSRDLEWEMRTRRPVISYPLNTTAGSSKIKLPVDDMEIGDAWRYVTVLLSGDGGTPTGYYSEKMNLKPLRPQTDGALKQLQSGVTIKRDQQNDNFGSPVYSDVVDVSRALAALPDAVYYSISPRYRLDRDYKLSWSDLLGQPQDLYTHKQIRLMDTSFTSRAPFDGIPIVYTVTNETAYDEQEYTILFYDRSYKALAYYTGPVHFNDKLAVNNVEKKINRISTGSALENEADIIDAQRAYSRLTASLQAQVNPKLRARLSLCAAELESAKYAGPLGRSLALIHAEISIPSKTFNGSQIMTFLDSNNRDLKKGLTEMALFVTKAPFTAADLAGPSTTGKFRSNAYSYNLVKGFKGGYYVTLVGYNSSGKPARYATAKLNFNPKTLQWDNTAVRVNEGVSLERNYRNGSRMDYVAYQEYRKAHPEAAYYTVAARSEFAQGEPFVPEQAVQKTAVANPVGSYERYQIAYEAKESLTGVSEEYIIIFYDKNDKAIHYYTGSLSD